MSLDEHLGEFPSVRKNFMFFLLGLLLFAAFMLTSTISYIVSRQSIRRTILEAELPLSSDNIYSEIQRDLFKPILISSLMANDTFVKDWIFKGETDQAAITRYLNQIQTRYDTISSFLVSDRTLKYYHPNGVIKVVSEDNPEDEWYFRVRQMQAPYELNVDLDKANENTMTIFINYRILDRDGNFIGATGVGLTVSAVKNLMHRYYQRFGRHVYFYDRQGNLVLHSHSEDDPAIPDHKMEKALQTVLEEVNSGMSNVSLSSPTSRGGLANYRYIPQLDWILVVEQPSDGTRKILFKTFAINFVVCLFTALVVFSIIRTAFANYHQHLENRNKLLQEKNERIREQAAELEKANKALDALHVEKNELIGITVHDLKNPLNSVLGFTDLLLMDQSVQGHAREYVGYIATSSRGMLEQLEDLLKLTELNSPHEVTLDPIDAAATVRLSVDDYLLHAKTKQLTLSLDLPSSPALVRAHQEWLVTCIDNLLSNAIKYSPPGGNISVSVSTKNGEVVIAVQDQGEGIDQTEQTRLFGKFERLSPRPTAGESSTGLGLFIVHQMITRMNGRVWCESRKGSGSTFFISLPLAA